MCCKTQSTQRQSVLRMFAQFFCALFIFATVLSAAFVLTHGEHEHDNSAANGGCAICAQLNAAVKVLNRISTAAVFGAVVFGGRFLAVLMSKVAGLLLIYSTPVALKIRLNN